MKSSHYLLPVFCLLVSTQAAVAEKHEMTQHGSHEHGAARLTVATTDSGLEIALETPAANVFGFEHQPKTAEQREVVHEAIEKLELGGTLFSMNAAADCTFDKADIDTPMDGGHDDHDDHDDHKAEKHDDHDDHKGHDDHKDHDDEKTHSDVDVTWSFNCKAPNSITSVDTKLFSAFPKGFEDIDVEWVTASNAGKVELESDGTITLKP